MARAAKLVGPDAAVEAVYVLKVPGQLSLDGGTGGGGARGPPRARGRPHAGQGRRLPGALPAAPDPQPRPAIVDEAKERRSDLIYISTEHAPSEERLLGPTMRYVLANRPCRVVVEHDPTAAGMDGQVAQRQP